jgi:hypothetical protein
VLFFFFFKTERVVVIMKYPDEIGVLFFVVFFVLEYREIEKTGIEKEGETALNVILILRKRRGGRGGRGRRREFHLKTNAYEDSRGI